jgi:hypothetical protein
MSFGDIGSADTQLGAIKTLYLPTKFRRGVLKAWIFVSVIYWILVHCEAERTNMAQLMHQNHTKSRCGLYRAVLIF